MDRVFLLLLMLGFISPGYLYLVDGTPPGCESCGTLEQQLVDSMDKIKILTDENTFLKQLTASSSSCRCPDGWIHGNGSCYYMPNQKSSWSAARAECQNLGGHLACITTAKEEAIVAGIIHRAQHLTHSYEGVNYVWLGGFDYVHEGHWQWVTGEPFVYSNWRITTIVSSEDCLDWSDGWNDNDCSQQNFFLCEM